MSELDHIASKATAKDPSDRFQSIDQLEKTEIKTHSTVTREELFIWPLGLALILALFALAYQALKPSPAP
ncbi:MAG: hypothetical protein ACPG6P_10175 [Akkermansiaceae bacterium]